MKTVLAFDFGASSGRAIKAVFDGEKIEMTEIHRFENIPLEIDGHVCHDVPMIMSEIKTAIEKAGSVDALAFDTWGVDYGLIGSDGNLVHMPYHYRDTRTAYALEMAAKVMPLSELYKETGNQVMNINTLFQLLSEDNLDKAEKLLFMPDLFCYLLTGNMVWERSISSTSQMMNPYENKWSEKVFDAYKINKSLFGEITPAPEIMGYYNDIPVISVSGHDTQCAVAAMPTESENAAFLSCGTWSLIGCELDTPVMTEKSNALELSNESGANGKTNYLKNISGLWLIQQIKKNLADEGKKLSYNELEMLARDSEPFKFLIDPDDALLSSHGNLILKIKEYCEKTGQGEPTEIGEYVRCVYESLALKYRLALEQISECTGRKFEVLHLLGGGTKDGFLCEMSAHSIGIPVIAGPVEATALGNIVLQLIALGEIKNISEGRKLIAQSEKLKKYEPLHTKEWDEAYEKYKKITLKEEI